MDISSHAGTVLLVIVGVISILSIILLGAIEAHRKDKGLHPLLRKNDEIPSEKKKV
jgi:hypothetical protein